MSRFGSSQDKPSASRELARLERSLHLLRQGQIPAALRVWRSVKVGRLRDPRELETFAYVALELGEPAQGLRILRQVLRRWPQRLQAQLLLGVAYRRLGKLSEAVSSFRRAVEQEPASADAHNNLALCLEELGQPAAALEVVRTGLDHNPWDADLLNLAGSNLCAMGRFQEGIASFRKALEVHPDFAAAHLNLGQELLRQDEYQEGFLHFEARLADAEAVGSAPAWQGQPVAGKRVLVWSEQGLGDGLHFARYLPRLAALGAEVHLLAPKPLQRLLTTVQGVRQVLISRQEAAQLDGVDYQVSLLSVPRWLPPLEMSPAASDTPYLRSEGEVAPELGTQFEGLRVGLVWAGNPDQAEDQRRSLDPGLLQPLLELDDIQFVSLQYGAAEQQLATELRSRMLLLGNKLPDFADLGTSLAQLDLLVTVDTAAAHLAGALGLEAWVLLPFAADWRWGTADQHSSWYPSLRLFRQPQPGDWEPPLLRMVEALRKRSTDREPRQS